MVSFMPTTPENICAVKPLTVKEKELYKAIKVFYFGDQVLQRSLVSPGNYCAAMTLLLNQVKL